MPICVAVPRIGRYAVAVRHDADGNGKSGWSDGGGFSRNPRLSLTRSAAQLSEVVAISVGNGVQADQRRAQLSAGPHDQAGRAAAIDGAGRAPFQPSLDRQPVAAAAGAELLRRASTTSSITRSSMSTRSARRCKTIARVKPKVLVINGGDGTVQAALTELYHGGHFGDNPPPVAVLPNGKTNLIAHDLGADGDPIVGARAGARARAHRHGAAYRVARADLADRRHARRQAGARHVPRRRRPGRHDPVTAATRSIRSACPTGLQPRADR